MKPHAPHRLLTVELLALDLDTCSRCGGTLTHIETALSLLRPALEATGTAVRFTKTLITSAAEAHQHRLVSSPTIRIDGRDLELAARESRCGDCTTLSGAAEGTDCRIWSYRGEDYAEAPVGLIVEALLRALVTTEEAAAPPPFAGVPENLQRFFAGRSQTPAGQDVCCSPAEQATCCDPAGKSACCTEDHPVTCGCR